MSGRKNNRRTSILKKRPSSDDDEPTQTFNTKIQRKLMFSQKQEVLEFAQCDEQFTIWGNKYETSVARSEGGSSDNATQQTLSDFHSMQISSHFVSTTATSMIEAEKENLEVVEKENLSVVGSGSHETSSVPEISIFLDSIEKAKIKEVQPANLNITNLPLDSSILATNKHLNIKNTESIKVFSPRKTVFLNKDFAVTVQDKVLEVPKAPEERFSLSLEEDENAKRTKARKTITKHVDMDISTHEPHSSDMVFKCPEIPKEFKFRKSFSSPPIKPELEMNKQDIDEMFDIIIQDTPSKNLCCLTPQRSASKTKAMSKVRKSNLLLHEFGLSESKSNSQIEDKVINVTDCSGHFKLDSMNDDDTGSLETTDELNKKASRLLKNPNATLRTLARPSIMISPASSANSTLTLDESINISKPMGLARSTTYAMQDMSVNNEQFQIFHDSMVEKESEKPRETIFNNNDISLDQKEQKTRPTIYEDYEIDESIHDQPSNVVFRKTTFEEEHMNASNTRKIDERIKITNPIGSTRCTTYAMQDMSVNNEQFEIFHDSMIKNVKEPRTTIFSHNEMDMTLKEEFPNQIVSKNRATTFQHNEMDISSSENFSAPINVSKPRATNFLQNEMDLTKSEEVYKPRTTTFMHNEMDLTLSEEILPQNNIPKSRATIFQNNEMDLSQADEVSNYFKPRSTTFAHNEMDLTVEQDIQPRKSILKSRTTTFEPNNIELSRTEQQSGTFNAFEKEGLNESLDVSMNEITEALPKELSKTTKNNRPSTFKDEIDETKENASLYDQSLLRHQTVNNEDVRISFMQQKSLIIDESIKNITISDQKSFNRSLFQTSASQESENREKKLPALEILKVNRETLYEEQEMEDERPKARPTIYENYKIDESIQDQPSNVVSRKTTFDYQQMNTSNIEEAQNTKNCQITFHQNKMDIEKDSKTRVTVYQNDMEMSGIDLLSQGVPPSAFETDNISQNLRESVIVNQNAGISSRKTSYEQLSMDTNDRRKTFLVKPKEDSSKWHNLTDADLNLIDDESNPCMDDSTLDDAPSQKLKKQKVCLGNISRYEEALDDFVNLTIVMSPLNTSNISEQPITAPSRRVSMALQPDRDYDTMLTNLVDKLKKKNEPKPRLAIDEYLEKLQIAAVKIERRPDLEPDAIRERINAKKEEIRKRRESKMLVEKNRNSMLPEIPDAVFLQKNYLDWLDEDIRRMVERDVMISPIFPEGMNFEYLLKNKFETDEHLNKYWILDTTFWIYQNFKFIHKKLIFFTISINYQQTFQEADESTIPILFTKVNLILGSKFRHNFKFPKRWAIMMKEFKNAIDGVCSFNSRCRSSNDLLQFLDWYHEKTKKAYDIVENFWNITYKYGGCITKDQQKDIYYAHKRHFLPPNEEGFMEAMDISVPIHTYIEKIAINDVIIKGKLYSYESNANSNANSLTGLMLLENILFDVEKFVAGNYQVQKLIY